MEIPEPIKEEVERKGGLDGIGSRLPPDDVSSRYARMHCALSDPVRFKVLHMLADQPLCVCCIKEILDITDSKLSYHISKLKEAGLIIGEQNKNWIIYRPTPDGLSMVRIGVIL
jgi:ArsR family transcriptional regulator